MSAVGGVQEWTPSGPYPIRWAHRAARRVRALDARHPVLWDALLTLVFAAAASVDVGGGSWRRIAHSDEVPVALVAAMAAGFVLALPWHRRRPLAAFAAMSVIGLVDAWVGTRLQVGQLGQLIVLFCIALRLPGKALTVAGALVVTQAAVGATRWPEGDWGQAFLPVVTGSVVVALLGIAVRSRRDYTASLVERARQLEVERDQQAQLAAAAERARIAREMHDIIGHNLSVITGLADGGSYAARKSPERAAQALTAIGATSRQALDELRRLLGVLRDDDDTDAQPEPELGPQPTLADLGTLVDRVREAGLPVRLSERGTPAPGSPGRELTVYRVVQEALTNTLKHAGPQATAMVEVTHAPHALSVAVIDTGGPARQLRHGQLATGDGHQGRGLRGMRERAALYDGALTAGPRSDGGWHVRLELPASPATPPPRPPTPRGADTEPQPDAEPRPDTEPRPDAEPRPDPEPRPDAEPGAPDPRGADSALDGTAPQGRKANVVRDTGTAHSARAVRDAHGARDAQDAQGTGIERGSREGWGGQVTGTVPGACERREVGGAS
ncbi:sensor histidine kinase [Streptomyces buecherae]|uniref:sensor histidine kinase n=1 Tax=Streptomyces buecherae TaxID=2763006 RepID=UPI0020B6EC44|nr:sensor histidine kinase [Streptomyces buecherae]